jgi:hypothetical protein
MTRLCRYERVALATNHMGKERPNDVDLRSNHWPRFRVRVKQ